MPCTRLPSCSPRHLQRSVAPDVTFHGQWRWPSQPAPRSGHRRLTAEQSSYAQARFVHKFHGGGFLAALRLQLENFDAAALGGDGDAVRANLGDFTRFAFDSAEGAGEMLARIEQLDLRAGER